MDTILLIDSTSHNERNRFIERLSYRFPAGPVHASVIIATRSAIETQNTPGSTLLEYRGSCIKSNRTAVLPLDGCNYVWKRCESLRNDVERV